MKKNLFVVILLVAAMVGLSVISACTHQAKGVVSDPIGTYDPKFRPSTPLATYNPDRDVKPEEFKQSLPLAKYDPVRDIKMEPNWVDTGDAKTIGKVDPCQGGECGNRNSNPKWQFTGQGFVGGIHIIYGRDGNLRGPRIQSKWFVPNREIQIIVTNWDGKSDITSRLWAAQAEARRTEEKILLKQLSADCGFKHCYVCEH